MPALSLRAGAHAESHLRCEASLLWDARGSGGVSVATAEAACTGASVTWSNRTTSHITKRSLEHLLLPALYLCRQSA